MTCDFKNSVTSILDRLGSTFRSAQRLHWKIDIAKVKNRLQYKFVRGYKSLRVEQHNSVKFTSQ